MQTFLAIVETGSLVRASERLHVSQSTVTARLKGLEEELGENLLRRNKSGIQLTAAGLKFKRYAEVMLDLWRQARQDTALPAGVERVCNLGCHADLWPTLGREILAEIRRQVAAAAVSAWPGQGSQLEQWLQNGVIDAALSYRRVATDKLAAHPLFEERLLLIADRPDRPMRFDPDYIYVEGGEEFAREHAAAYTDAGIAKISFGCAVWALDHLLDHGGSAYLPETMIRDHVARGRLFEIVEAPVFTRMAYLITNKSKSENWAWLTNLMDELVSNQQKVIPKK